ncbi:putative O-methyltransferase YrrM [Natronocella acetinitrilica]|jgi:O-methyltransferase|uniref:O-methyltransferase YrrM n=1 Tax=Natronocella acetinitrilica TaxID=414046 RepID=A0AAE3G4V5_9GAMM|nr:class I SAM-dependent methyltransferase [Natronocella acetinitrilica]MCP1675104.1 putative O-methyltransferase YrrM [Natronocella acetinitrilica]
MTRRSLAMNDALQTYLQEIQAQPSPLEQRLMSETATLPGAKMQIALEQARFMRMLVAITGARRCLEIGTFTGFSALAVAQALPEDGTLLTLDLNPETTAIARRYWDEAGVGGKITARIGPALEAVAMLLEDHEAGFDFIFIDADKANYPRYFELCVELIHPGGLILVDNVLWSGRVVDGDDHSADTEGIRAFNRLVRDEPRVDHCVIPLADGLTLARRLPG